MGRSTKLAERVAGALLDDIASQGWPVGQTVATKAELMARHGVGQATIVEASRQLEQLGVARLQRGAGGGLLVTHSVETTVSRTVATYLELVGTPASEQMEIWRIVQEHALPLAAARLDEDGAIRLRTMVDALRQSRDGAEFYGGLNALEFAVIDAAKNRATSVLARVMQPYWDRAGWAEALGGIFATEGSSVIAAMAEVVEALVAGDPAAARSPEPAISGFWKRIADAGLPAGQARDRRRKLGEETAIAVRDDIRDRGLLPGDMLGLMRDLLARYGVGTPAMREAIRLLELHGIVRAKPGRGGGLVVGRPDPAYTVSATASFLLHTDITPADMTEVRRDLLLAAIGTTTRLRDGEALQLLQDAIGTGQPIHDRADEAPGKPFYRALARATPNRMLGLLVEICSECLGRRPWPESNPDATEHVSASHAAVAEAMLAGDGPLARRRMLDMLARGSDVRANAKLLLKAGSGI